MIIYQKTVVNLPWKFEKFCLKTFRKERNFCRINQTMTSYRASGPKSVAYNELSQLIDSYYDQLRKGNQSQNKKFMVQIRKHVLTKQCSEEDLKPETDSSLNANNHSSNQPMGALQRLNSLSHSPTDKLLKIGKALPTIRKVEDTLRGRLWRCMVGTPSLSCNDYQKQINAKEYVPTYVRLRGDTKRTFASSEEYMSRVSEERLVRVLNSYCQKYNKPYVQGMNVVAGGYVCSCVLSCHCCFVFFLVVFVVSFVFFFFLCVLFWKTVVLNIFWSVVVYTRWKEHSHFSFCFLFIFFWEGNVFLFVFVIM